MLFAALWLLAELLRGTWFTGFPWARGLCPRAGPLSSLPRVVGVYGVGAISAGLAMALVQCRWRDLRTGVPGSPRCVLLGAGGLPGCNATARWSCATPLPSARRRHTESWRCCRAIFLKTKNLNRAAACTLALAWYAEQLRSEPRFAGGGA